MLVLKKCTEIYLPVIGGSLALQHCEEILHILGSVVTLQQWLPPHSAQTGRSTIIPVWFIILHIHEQWLPPHCAQTGLSTILAFSPGLVQYRLTIVPNCVVGLWCELISIMGKVETTKPIHLVTWAWLEVRPLVKGSEEQWLLGVSFLVKWKKWVGLLSVTQHSCSYDSCRQQCTGWFIINLTIQLLFSQTLLQYWHGYNK